MPTNRLQAGSDDASASTPLDLARQPPFALGGLTVTPAALSVVGCGLTQRLEPRAMQMLVVLAQASPAVIGRGELNRRVWGGRVVGEDAINRAVQTLRRLAGEASPKPFAIETIPRVGYRLTIVESGLQVPTPIPRGSARGTQSGGRRWRWLGWVSAATIALAAFLAWRLTASRPGVPTVWHVAGSATFDDLPSGATDVALSPDGRRLAYRGKDQHEHERIFVRTVEGGGVGSAVSAPNIDARRPAWSPDGTALAFVAYDPGRPCRLYVLRGGRPASSTGSCETERDPGLAWSADGRSLLFGDSPGWNAVRRITAIDLGDGRRSVLSSPPGDSLGDVLPQTHGLGIIFQRVYGYTDLAWIAREAATGRERVLWRNRGVAVSVAAQLPDGTLAVAWTRAGASGLDLIAPDGKARSQPVVLGPVSAISAARDRLLVETDHSESALVRAGTASPVATLASARGRMSAPMLLPGGRLRFPITSAGMARVWESDGDGTQRTWGPFAATRIVGLALSPDARLTAAMATGNAGREIVVFDANGRPVYRWNPHSRSLNPAAWSGDGRRLIVPILDGAGWRLLALDPFAGARPRDLNRNGFAVVFGQGPALYAVRAGETTGGRELWRLDGNARRLPIDLSLLDIVNWRAVDEGIWLPDRSDREHPRLTLREMAGGRVVRSVAAPGLSEAATGLAADDHGPVYVQRVQEAPEHSLLTLSRAN